MPNWCSNTLTITKGEPSVVLDAIRTERWLFDFDALIPKHREIADAHQLVNPEFGARSWNSTYAKTLGNIPAQHHSLRHCLGTACPGL